MYHLYGLAGSVTCNAGNVLYKLRESSAMPGPETDWVDGIIPPARHWRVAYRYVGHFTGGIYDSSDDCFAANAVCRRIFSRYPTDRDGNYTPLTIPQPVDPADLSDGDDGYSDRSSDIDTDEVGSASNGSLGDGDSGGEGEALLIDDSGSGGAEDMLLANACLYGLADNHSCPVCDPAAFDVLHEER